MSFLKRFNFKNNFNSNFLSEKDEDILERKIVWIFGTVRSGSTWLRELMTHPANITWHEPYICWHLSFHRKNHHERNEYFFSKQTKDEWLPYLRKLILARTYSHAKTMRKNIIIKEVNGVLGADIVLECFPNSKFILLVRDGRDVVDSLIDAHKKDSWNKDLTPFSTPEDRFNAIRRYSNNWKTNIDELWHLYEKHNPNLKRFVKYKNLRENTFDELKKIYNFLNVNINEIDLQKIIDKYNFEKIPESKKGSGKFTRQAKPGGWQKSFNPNEIELMNTIMKETLIKFGYDI